MEMPKDPQPEVGSNDGHCLGITTGSPDFFWGGQACRALIAADRL